MNLMPMSPFAYSLILLPWTLACSSSTTTVHQIGGSTSTVTTGGAQIAGGNGSAGDSSTSLGGAVAAGGTSAGSTQAAAGTAASAGDTSTPQGGLTSFGGTNAGTAGSGGTGISSGSSGVGGATGGTLATPTGGATVNPTGGMATVTSGGSTADVTGGATGNPTGGATTGGLGTACTLGAAKCGGAETETNALKCRTDQTGYDVVGYCSDTDLQCNPATGTCFTLGVEATEVTRAQYAAFVASAEVTQVPGCAAFNTSFAPDANCMADPTVCQGSGCDSHPQVCIDWCDAYAYCAHVGKRLCGRISGGMNPFDRAADPGSSQWMNACSAGGQYKYGSGARVDSGPAFCNYVGTQLGTTHAVGTHAGCTSPSPTYDHLMDLSGNVAEWEDSCERPIDTINLITGSDACRTRGGSFSSPLAALSCDAVPASALRRDAVAPDVGFRCCSVTH